MKRAIAEQLQAWKQASKRKPLVIRGARQVGKTFEVRELGQLFDNYVEINFEQIEEAKQIFAKDLSPGRIVRDLSLLVGQKIEPGKSLLFFDEIQAAPKAITALRYFYEEMPDLHVIAAGSLLDFALEQIGVPVGRISYLYLYPMSFIEFLSAVGEELLAAEILKHQVSEPITELIHQKSLELLGIYVAVGGMPEAVQCWKDSQDLFECSKIHNDLVENYRQDFQKYAKKYQIKYVDLLFDQIPRQMGQPFIYARVAGGYRKRELEPCLDLLEKAGMIHRVIHTAGNGVPLGAEANHEKFKVVFLDIALAQYILGYQARDWVLNPQTTFINKGELVEAFVGQELLAYATANQKHQLYYWHKDNRGSSAEVDYLIQQKEDVIPIEVKSGKGGHLKSLRMFLDSHKSSYGIRFSTQNYSIYDGVHSYPLYAVAKVVGED
ncbi:MAG: ATP-binding protein [Gammaproteobacteria bacterium]|nr:ATP-binding protein [Gammaproteobacteria bacterium]